MEDLNEEFDFEAILDEAQKEKIKDKKVSEQELIDKWQKKYDSNKALRMLKKLRRNTRSMPGVVKGPTQVVIELLGHLLSALDNKDLPKAQKVLVMGAIGYIISPADLVLDFIPIIGFIDDIASTVYVVQTVRKYSTFNLKDLDALIDSEIGFNDEEDDVAQDSKTDEE